MKEIRIEFLFYRYKHHRQPPKWLGFSCVSQCSTPIRVTDVKKTLRLDFVRYFDKIFVKVLDD